MPRQAIRFHARYRRGYSPSVRRRSSCVFRTGTATAAAVCQGIGSTAGRTKVDHRVHKSGPSSCSQRPADRPPRCVRARSAQSGSQRRGAPAPPQTPCRSRGAPQRQGRRSFRLGWMVQSLALGKCSGPERRIPRTNRRLPRSAQTAAVFVVSRLATGQRGERSPTRESFARRPGGPLLSLSFNLRRRTQVELISVFAVHGT
jgi:hypothetical protein